MHNGHCECGSVAFTITAPLKAPSACHCSQCRRLSGHYWSGTSVLHGDLTFTRSDALTWYASSDRDERGFCSKCGSSLFYRPLNDDHVSVAMGSLDAPTGTALRRHIFVADKGDYYQIGNDIPKIEEW